MKLFTLPCCCLLLLTLVACSGQNSSDPVAAGQALDTVTGTPAGNGSGGVLDATFGNGGIVTASVGTSDKVAAMLVQPDGKLVEVGTATVGGQKQIAIVRFHPDGRLDDSFGTSGKVHSALGPNGGEVGGAAFQPDGKIVVAGYAFNGNNNDIVILRFNTDGSHDTVWGNPGSLLSSSTYNEIALGVTVQADGRLIVAGSASSGTSSDFLVARFTPAGALDDTFADRGVVRLALTPAAQGDHLSLAQYVATGPDDTILAAGTVCQGSGTQSTYNGAVVRLQRNGTLDTRFGSGGTVTGIPGFVTSFTTGKDDRFYVGTYQGKSLYRIYRFSAGGAADATFGKGGYAETLLPMDVMALAEDQQGRLVAAGQNPIIFNLMLLRLRNDGSPDPTFGSGGIASSAFSVFDAAMAVQLDGTGRLLVGGFTSTRAPATEFLLARFLP